MEILTPLLAFILGITTAATFCSIHLLSSVAVYSLSTQAERSKAKREDERSSSTAGKYDKLRPLLISFGHFLSIILIGLVVIGLGLIIEDYLIYLEIPAILFIFIIGWYLLFSKKINICSSTCGCQTDSIIDKLKSNGLFKSFLFGFSIGLLCVGCIIPIFGTMIAMRAVIGYEAILLIFSYTIGHTLPILAVAYIPYVTKKFTKDKIEKNIIIIRKISGIILIIIGLYLFWDLFIYNH